jgi:DNA-binding beta-propeller fold protein YncE
MIRKATVKIFAVFAAILLFSQTVYAFVPFTSITFGLQGPLSGQIPYIPIAIITDIGEHTLNNPNAIIADNENGHLYIADTGNGRILVSDMDGKFVRVIGEGVLSNPTGLFRTAAGYLYVADSGHELVFMFDSDDSLIKEFGRPTSPLYGDHNSFRPLKVAADAGGNVFVISEGNNNGIIQLSNTGEFLGYFGANRTRTDFLNVLRRFFYSEEQLANFVVNIPRTPDNLTMSDEGLVFTVTKGGSFDAIKKLNRAGRDILNTMGGRFMNFTMDPTKEDIHIGPYGNILVVTQLGYIYELSDEGAPIFMFSGPDDGTQRLGLLRRPTGIAADNDSFIYVLDGERNGIHVFEPTDFVRTVHLGYYMQQNGLYAESKEVWQQVLRMDSNFLDANNGLGRAFMRLGQHSEARKAFENGNAFYLYSDAFWEVRNIWLNQNLGWIFSILLGLTIIRRVIKYFNDKKQILRPLEKGLGYISDKKLVSELKYVMYFVRHPMDGYYGIKVENKTSILSASIIYVLIFLMFVMRTYFTGYIFSPWVTEFNIPFDAAMIFGAIAAFVVCHYLVSTIRDGEGSFRVVYMALAYSMVPILLLQPLIFALSHVLTLNELFIYNFLGLVCFMWFAMLMIVNIREIHNYTYRGAVANVFLTFFTMLILALILFLVFAMSGQLLDFWISFSREVTLRVLY